MEPYPDVTLGVALDLSVAEAGCEELVLEILADVVVFYDEISHLALSGEPVGIPLLDNTDAKAVRINFMSHVFLLMPRVR